MEKKNPFGEMRSMAEASDWRAAQHAEQSRAITKAALALAKSGPAIARPRCASRRRRDCPTMPPQMTSKPQKRGKCDVP